MRGLVHADVSEPGIRRRRSGSGFVHLDPSGRRIARAATLDRIASLAILLLRSHDTPQRARRRVHYRAATSLRREVRTSSRRHGHRREGCARRSPMSGPSRAATPAVSRRRRCSRRRLPRRQRLHPQRLHPGATSADFTAKTFRTWGASAHATLLLTELGTARGERDPSADIRDVVRDTAALLRNTPAVCRNSYVHPAALDAHESGELHEIRPSPRRARWLAPHERQLLAVLEVAARPRQR
jgi:DNA topoisomerase IB